MSIQWIFSERCRAFGRRLEHHRTRAVRQREPQELCVERRRLRHAVTVAAARVLVEARPKITARELAARHRGNAMFPDPHLRVRGLERHERAGAHALKARDLDRAELELGVHVRREPRQQDVAERGGGGEIRDVAEHELGGIDRGADRGGRHARVRMPRDAGRVERVVPRADLVVAQHERSIPRRLSADSAEVALHLVVTDGRTGEKRTEPVDIDIEHARLGLDDYAASPWSVYTMVTQCVR